MHAFELIGFVLVFLILLVIAKLALDKPSQNKTTPKSDRYKQKETLFTTTEQKFLAALDIAVQGRYHVFGMVRVADVLEPERRRNQTGWQSAFNRIQAKHFDFVLCNPADLQVAAVVELDDSSHAQRDRKDRDRFLDEACASADLPLIHFPVKAKYDVAAVRAQISEALGTGEAAQPAKTMPTCPNCGHSLEHIEGREGALAGKPIWRCERYPECRTLIPVL